MVNASAKRFVDRLIGKLFGDGGDGLGRLGQKDGDRGVGDNFYLQTGRLGSLCSLSTEPCDPFSQSCGQRVKRSDPHGTIEHYPTDALCGSSCRHTACSI